MIQGIFHQYLILSAKKDDKKTGFPPFCCDQVYSIKVSALPNLLFRPVRPMRWM